MNDSSKQSYPAYRDELKQEQGSLSKEEVAELMRRRSEHQLDLDNMQPQQHNWVPRGVVMSCEGANHPNHRAFKRR